MLGRWHGMNGQGFAISESSDPKAMYRWVAQWSDLLQLTVTPCLEDADAGEVMASLPRRFGHRSQSSAAVARLCAGTHSTWIRFRDRPSDRKIFAANGHTLRPRKSWNFRVMTAFG